MAAVPHEQASRRREEKESRRSRRRRKKKKHTNYRTLNDICGDFVQTHSWNE